MATLNELKAQLEKDVALLNEELRLDKIVQTTAGDRKSLPMILRELDAEREQVIAYTQSYIIQAGDDQIAATAAQINQSGSGWLALAQAAAQTAQTAEDGAQAAQTAAEAARNTANVHQADAKRYRDEAQSARDTATAIALGDQEALFWGFVKIQADQALRQFEFNERLIAGGL